jgi:hypothetical protein
MQVVGIYGLTEQRKNRSADLARVLGATAYEAASRLRVPGSGPIVIAVVADPQNASDLAAKLNAADFPAFVLTAAEIEAGAGQLPVRKFSLTGQGLIVESAGGGIEVPYGDVRLILRGTSIATTTSIETSKERKFSLERALLSGGVMLTRNTKTVREKTAEEREVFFTLYAKARPSLLFCEKALSYDSFGPARKPSSSANMAFLISELRNRCPSAGYDDRLLTRASQAALLGPTLRPEGHLAVAVALLANILIGKAG